MALYAVRAYSGRLAENREAIRSGLWHEPCRSLVWTRVDFSFANMVMPRYRVNRFPKHSGKQKRGKNFGYA